MNDILNIFKALSDETRLRILKLLEQGELCVCDIVAALDMIQPKVSFHLGVLKDAGLIKDRKQGKWIHYSIDDSDMFRRFLLLSTFERIPNESLKDERKRLKEFLQGKKQKSNVVQSPPMVIQRPSSCYGNRGRNLE
jgi:ArsR family transcriptional regulator